MFSLIGKMWKETKNFKKGGDLMKIENSEAEEGESEEGKTARKGEEQQNKITQTLSCGCLNISQ